MTISVLLFRVKAFVNYWLRKEDEHSLHSPFVYDFYLKCLKSDRHFSDSNIESLRQDLLSDETVVIENQLGAPSKTMGKRTVSSIVKGGTSSNNRSQLLCGIIDYLEFKNVLELGTSVGLNAAYLTLPQKVEKVVSVEGNQQLHQIAINIKSHLGCEKLELVLQDVDSYFEQLSELSTAFDFIYLDANHTYEATLRYYHELKQFSSPHSVLVIDDIHWSGQMNKAWNEIKKDSKEVLTIEKYNLGIVFGNGYEAKGHYILDF